MFTSLRSLSHRRSRWVILFISLWLVLPLVLSSSAYLRPSLAELSSTVSGSNGDLASSESQGVLPSVRRPGIIVNQIGNIHYAEVRLDGYPLIQVTAEVPSDIDENAEDRLPVELRVERIQNQLNSVISHPSFDPNQAELIPSILNDQTVLIYTGRNRPVVLLTVTDLDARLADRTIEELAEIWRHDILEALIRAWRQRQPPYLLQQAWTAAQILARVIVISTILFLLQRTLQQRSRAIKNRLVIAAEITQDQAPFPSEASPAFQHQRETLPDQAPYGNVIDIQHLISLRHLLLINKLPEQLLFWGQVSLWIMGSIRILYLFPQTREVGTWVLGIPWVLLIIILILSTLSRLFHLITGFMISRWLREKLLNANEIRAKRFDARAQTYLSALHGVEDRLLLLIGMFSFLYIINIPLSSLLTGAGVLGVIVSIGAQGLVKDFISGCLILFEDQYALRDWVSINGVFGEVVYMNLRVTKLRNLEGSLISIPNGTITLAENLTNEWANVNFQVDVDYQIDPEKVLKLMRKTAEELKRDPEWESLIIDPVVQLVVTHLSHQGQRMRILIKTQPGRQWPVEFEYRRRLKSVFDRAGITIGIPQSMQFYERKGALGNLDRMP